MSETAEMEAQAAAILARRGDARSGASTTSAAAAATASPGGVAGAPDGAAGVAGASEGGGPTEGKGFGECGGGGSGGGGEGKEFIDAHRMVVSLRSDPMRAMLRSGEWCGRDAVRSVVVGCSAVAM